MNLSVEVIQPGSQLSPTFLGLSDTLGVHSLTRSLSVFWGGAGSVLQVLPVEYGPRDGMSFKLEVAVLPLPWSSDGEK